MKIKYQCRECGTKSDFDTDEAPVSLIESVDPTSGSDTTYVVNCPVCGVENRVSAE